MGQWRAGRAGMSIGTGFWLLWGAIALRFAASYWRSGSTFAAVAIGATGLAAVLAAALT